MFDEISARTGFAGNRLVRGSEHRSEETLRAALDHPDARVLLGFDGGWMMRSNEICHEAHFSVSDARRFGARFEDAVLLGTDDEGRPRLAMPLAEIPTEKDLVPLDLRSIAEGALLDTDAEGQLAQAAHLLSWHRSHRFCGRCGGPTVAEAAGMRRRCTACDTIVFPRTDPVTIMLVHDGRGNAILGRQPRFRHLAWSCLAGFVEPGETVEDAVRRETKEEAGVTVGRVSYLASQPWPFPGSLMIGCLAEAATVDIDFDGDELEDCRWFSRQEVRLALAREHPDGITLPGRFAIAHHLIKAFADGEV
ncbi:NAD(+) diphosphatase [Consotaella aegiceratis]|uniref:NAD(+) diphosphatase n=1 Tax=Consotaella aegiceratis TaxID=3097961 RepID=UPI002F408A0B